MVERTSYPMSETVKDLVLVAANHGLQFTATKQSRSYKLWFGSKLWFAIPKLSRQTAPNLLRQLRVNLRGPLVSIKAS